MTTDTVQTSKGLPSGEGLPRSFVEFAMRERYFLIFIAVAFLFAGATYTMPAIAMWFGFALAGYSTVANDSIQTLGTFIASNGQRPWWHLWLWIGGIFLITVTYSWYTYDGDVTYQRLASKGFETAPSSFHFLQVAAPIFLLIITRLKMPVSTTFLLLSCFATSGKSIGAIIIKSISGYFIAFGVAIVVWLIFSRLMQRLFVRKPHPAWHTAQWATTGLLWAAWLMQDAANVAVFLPRSLSFLEFAVFAGLIFLGLGLLFRQRGERIQEVVDEKTDVVDVRAATIIDAIYAVILYVFKIVSKVPMSTTWVFIGLLAGREIGIAIRKASSDDQGMKPVLKMVGKDLVYVTLGFLISLVIAAASNPVVREALF